MMPATSHGWLLRFDLQGDQEQDAGDPLEDRQRVDEPVADGLDLARAEVRVLRLLPGHRPHDRVGEGRSEGQDRPHDVQEQEERRELDEIHALPPRAGGPVPGRCEG